ncbi:MAG: type II toxin-antitoxin system Phd/YefM family antitoxin, partial [Deltaproteobacteria bacterium]|nr:type II toxin-antitoxin system Phd/YefM family antitoxin [Deltaproteobacteria bacterium]
MEINAAEFRANCFKILDQVKVTHKEVIITKRGKPVAKLVHFARQNEK